MEPFKLGIKSAIKALKRKEFSPGELLDSVLSRISSVDPKIHAYITVTDEKARERLESLGKLSSEELPLSSIPLAIKDNLCTQGIRTTCASRILENFIPPYESTVTGKLLNAGAIFTGKTNLDEFAM